MQKHLIYKVENPSVFVETLNEDGTPTFTTVEAMAMEVEADEVEAFINDRIVPAGTEFWGGRPIRIPQ
jgi:hypothetical protein